MSIKRITHFAPSLSPDASLLEFAGGLVGEIEQPSLWSLLPVHPHERAPISEVLLTNSSSGNGLKRSATGVEIVSRPSPKDVVMKDAVRGWTPSAESIRVVFG